MIFKVHVSGMKFLNATVSVEASSREEALDQALDRAAAGEVDWEDGATAINLSAEVLSEEE